MTREGTVAQLFELAIRAENLAETLYRGLAKKFAHRPEVADFWAGMAGEERAHAHALEQIRDGLTAEQLQAPADPQVLAQARAVQYLDVEDALARITNLQVAYELVSAHENEETNTVFEFLITNFPVEAKAQQFLRDQLGEHLMRLMRDFPERFGTADRRRHVTALDVPGGVESSRRD